MKVERCTSQ